MIYLVIGPSVKIAAAFLATAVFFVAFLNINFALVILIFAMLLSPEIPIGGIPGRAVKVRIDDVTVTGRVTDPAGDPIAGARVSAEPLDVPHPSGDDGFDHIQSEPVETATDSDGRYRIEGLLPAHFKEVGGYFATGNSLPRDGRTYTLQARAVGFAT